MAFNQLKLMFLAVCAFSLFSCGHANNMAQSTVETPQENRKSPESGVEDGEKKARLLSSSKAISLGPGDVIRVVVYDEKDLTGDYDVFDDGTIVIPLIGKVSVLNKAPPEAAKEIKEKLSNGYLREPHVTITLKSFNSKKVYILGEVKKPGSLVYRQNFTVVQLISEAEGFKETASTNDVRLTRRRGGEQQTFLIPVMDITRGEAPDFPLQPGDVVFVPRRMF